MSTIHRDSAEIEWHGPFVMARACTTIALTAYTYANGTAGVGATITLNANAALPTVDGVTLVVGDVVLVQNGAAFSDNGLYSVTALGDGSTTPGVLTRDPRCDTQAKILAVAIKIREGNSRRGALYEYCNSPSITVGTTALAWLRVDQNRGFNEYVVSETDFEQQVLTLANNGVMAGSWPGFVTLSGTSSIAPKLVPTQDKRGVFTFSVTTTTAVATLSFAGTPRPVMLDVSQYFELELSIAGPTALSDGSDTYRVIAGLGSGTTVANADGIWVEYTQATSTRWLGVARASSTSSTTGSTGPTVATTTYTRCKIVKYAGESVLHVFFDGVEATLAAGNVPLNVALTPIITLTKSAGNTNARAFDIDYFRWVQAWPNGRAA